MDKMMFGTTKQQLVMTPLPLQTNTYKPVDNRKLIDTTLEGIEKAGFRLDKEMYSSAREGRQSNGRYTIKNVADDEMQLMIGWQNSYDKTLSLKFAIGVSVFICSNGSVSGDMGTFKRKHDGDIQEFSITKITEYIKQAGETFYLMQQNKAGMKNQEVTKRTCAELVGRLFLEEELINVTQLGIIKREIEAPTYDYKAPGSAWELYNHCTHALKNTHPADWMQKHQGVHNFFVNETGELDTIDWNTVEDHYESMTI